MNGKTATIEVTIAADGAITQTIKQYFPAAPTAADVKITRGIATTHKVGVNVPTTMEYRVVSSDGKATRQDWTDGTGAAVDTTPSTYGILPGDKIEVRVKATAPYPAGSVYTHIIELDEISLPSSKLELATGIVLQVGETMKGDIKITGSDKVTIQTFTSLDSSIATIESKDPLAWNGATVTAYKAGTTTIHYLARVSENQLNARDSIEINVYAAADIIDPEYNDTLNSTSGKIELATAITAASGQTITWTSETEENITVDEITGEITWVQAGESVISYEIINDATGHIVQKGSVTVTAE